MLSELEELLALNSVDKNQFSTELYHTLLIGAFAAMVREIEAENAWLDVKNKYRNSADHIHVTKLLVKQYIGGAFREKDYELFYRLIDARLRKKQERKTFSDELKTVLLASQDGRCNICNSKIDLKTAELDHIVPWSLVGDELSSNLQMLCVKCNRRKSATVDYALLSTFLIRE